MLSPMAIAYDLMAIDSTSGAEGEVIAHAENLLRELGWTTRRIAVTPGRDDLLATAGDTIDVTLSTHLDTVPPYIPPSRDGDLLHGRGACDAKGIAAAMICAADQLRAQGVNVALLFVVGEETCHDGAHAANAWAAANLPNTPRRILNGEPTENTLALGTKGAMRVIARAAGRAAHSAYPELGVSATEILVAKLAQLPSLTLPSDPVLGATTINIGTIAGGVADNVVAPWAEARLMARLVTPPEDVFRLLQLWAGDALTLEAGVTVPPVRLGTLPGMPTSVAAFATDIPALTNWGEPFLFGPGSIHVAHTMGEYVTRKDLEAAVEGYVKLARG